MKPLRPAVAGPARASLALLLAAACPPLAAEPLGLLAGRTADPALQPALSLEAGYIVLDDGSFVGGRVNFRAAERVVLYGDVGRFEGDDDEAGLELSGTPFGVGLFYLLPETSAVADLAVRASYHTTDIDIDPIEGEFVAGFESDLSSSEASVSLLASGREALGENGLRWFGSVGYHRTEFGGDVSAPGRGSVDIDDDSSDFGFSVGLVLPLTMGELWAGYEGIDGDGNYGGGFRYFVE